MVQIVQHQQIVFDIIGGLVALLILLGVKRWVKW